MKNPFRLRSKATNRTAIGGEFGEAKPRTCSAGAFRPYDFPTFRLSGLPISDLPTSDLQTSDLPTSDLQTSDLQTSDLQTLIPIFFISSEALKLEQMPGVSR
jgi:hypothetical protein